MYNAALKLDPSKSGRPLAAWLRKDCATPMEEDRGAKRPAAAASGSQSSSPRGASTKEGKKTRSGSAKPRGLQLEAS